jgi:hypothetical protein
VVPFHHDLMFLLCASIINHDSPLKEFQQERSRPINVMSHIMILFAKLHSNTELTKEISKIAAIFLQEKITGNLRNNQLLQMKPIRWLVKDVHRYSDLTKQGASIYGHHTSVQVTVHKPIYMDLRDPSKLILPFITNISRSQQNVRLESHQPTHTRSIYGNSTGI